MTNSLSPTSILCCNRFPLGCPQIFSLLTLLRLNFSLLVSKSNFLINQYHLTLHTTLVIILMNILPFPIRSYHFLSPLQLSLTLILKLVNVSLYEIATYNCYETPITNYMFYYRTILLYWKPVAEYLEKNSIITKLITTIVSYSWARLLFASAVFDRHDYWISFAIHKRMSPNYISIENKITVEWDITSRSHAIYWKVRTVINDLETPFNLNHTKSTIVISLYGTYSLGCGK